MTAVTISAKGNAVGFTATGETITGRRSGCKTAWRIEVYREIGLVSLPVATDDRNRSFPSKATAAAYAATLIDDEATARLAWWL